MSYDLNFWKYKPNTLSDHQKVYEKASDGELVEGLEDLPIDSILAAVQLEFKDWQEEQTMDSYENPKGKGAFQISLTNQFVRYDCYGMEGQDMNRIIDVMSKFDCPLYDPQVPQRFDNSQ